MGARLVIRLPAIMPRWPGNNAEVAKGQKWQRLRSISLTPFGQQEQLKRLLKQKILISDAPKATLSEIEAQIKELKRLLAQLESDIQDQLRRGQ
jgi:hypothetical protein